VPLSYGAIKNKNMNKRQNKKKLGREMCSPDGKEDAFIHDYILDNPEANRISEDLVIRQAVDKGMPLATAIKLFRSKK
jgi:hypothetical protein